MIQLQVKELHKYLGNLGLPQSNQAHPVNHRFLFWKIRFLVGYMNYNQFEELVESSCIIMVKSSFWLELLTPFKSSSHNFQFLIQKWSVFCT